jgi:hypothetical protein
MGNGCAALVGAGWSTSREALGNCWYRIPSAKNGVKNDVEAGWTVREVCSGLPAGEHGELLASEHLRQNGAAE